MNNDTTPLPSGNADAPDNVGTAAIPAAGVSPVPQPDHAPVPQGPNAAPTNPNLNETQRIERPTAQYTTPAQAQPPAQVQGTAPGYGAGDTQPLVVQAAANQQYGAQSVGAQSVGGSPVSAAPTAAKKKSMAMPIIATAALSAILASAATVGVTAALDNSSEQPTQSTTQQEANGTGSKGTVAPIENSTNQNPNWEAVTNAVAKTVVAIEVEKPTGGAQGSGVIIDSEGHIITNNHVVENAKNNEVSVTLDDGRMYTAEITGLDAATDLAVIKIKNPPADLASATIADSSQVTVGSSVLAMGNPLGLSQTATTGIVSALDRPVATSTTQDGTLVVTNAIQIDAAINPGNSGGPLFNSKGEVIGITSSIATMSSGMTEQSGSIGLGFAIPSNLAQNISEQLIKNGEAEHAFLGVTMSDGSGTANDETRQGAVVQDVTQGSAADKAGLKKGDVIVSVDDRAVTGFESLTGHVREHSAGDTIKLGVIRGNERIEVEATLTARTETATTIPDEQDDNQDGSQGGGGFNPWGQGDSQNDGQGSQGGRGNIDPSNPSNVPSWEDLQEFLEQFQRGQQGRGN